MARAFEKEFLMQLCLLLSSLQTFTAFVCLCVTISIAASDQVRIGLGHATYSAFVVISLLFFASLLSNSCARYGTRQHNKFCLAVFILSTLFIGGLVLLIYESLGLTSRLQASPQECSSQQPADSNPCGSYYESAAVQNLRELWNYNFIKSRDDQRFGSKYHSLLDSVQTQGSCCGIEPPYSCKFGDSVQNPQATDDVIPTYCGSLAHWYPPSYECRIRVTEADGSVANVGCPFHLPVSQCYEFGFTHGCMYELEKSLQSSVKGKMVILSNLIFVNFALLFFYCCLIMKRKDNDVLPTRYVVEQIERDKKELDLS